MKLRTTLLWLGLAGAAIAPLHAAETLSGATARSQKDLDASLGELSALRERIAAERVPLTKELEGLERRVTDLRREQGEVLKQLDQSGLDSANLQAELKLRQEEIAYVGSLLDEYTSSFGSKLDPSETSRYSATLEKAKTAHGDASLPPQEKIERQLEVVKASIARVQDVLGGSRFQGAAVDPQGVVKEGQFALIGPIALFSSADGTAAGLALPQTGSARPAVRPLDEPMTRAIAQVVTQGEGLLPLDPTRGGAIKELVQRASLIHIFRKGGPIMWPLLAVSILALATVIERIIFLASEKRKVDEEGLQEVLGAVQAGDTRRALNVAKSSEYYVVRALGYALMHRERSLPSALMYASAKELKRFTRGLPILDTAITISPLLGLLGTVTGMMGSFSLIGGDLSAPSAITGGIAEALIATAFGLGIAIVALIPFNYLNNRVEEARHELETAAAQLELLVTTPGAAARPAEREVDLLPEPVTA